ncbi:redoxin family protein [Candidatus Wolfebacteria bacterium]|nr:redoxin family protein [Candidatus Wolfebacteria bacterium]
MKAEYIIGIIVLGLVGIGLVVLFVSPNPSAPEGGDAAQALSYREIVNPSGFVNTEGITLGELVGEKVILVDFLTYSCINCQRTFPYLNAWYEKYKDQGLEIVGIHTPEFAFERDIDNVRQAMKRFGITHPIVLDNDYATWRAYGNTYWPRKYLIDINGYIVYDHIGEGAYDETERAIQAALTERNTRLGEEMDVPSDIVDPEDKITVDSSGVGTPELYFGSRRNSYLANGTPGVDGVQTFVIPETALPNALYLGGTWTITPEYAEGTGSADIVLRYRAKNIYMVASAADGTTVTVKIDGEETKTFSIQAEELYTLQEGSAYGEHTITVHSDSAGLRVFTFTFG